MALGDSITDTDVRGALGESTYDIFTLCVSSLINKWSKKKPIRDAGSGANWPAGADSKYGFNLPTNWDYLQPRGGSEGGSPDEPGRLDDFRGYEHSKDNAFPTIQCRQGECTSRDLDPIPGGNYYNLWKVRFFKTASNIKITPADLGFSGYYFGLKITNSTGTYYKTYGTIAAVDDSGMQFTVDATLADSEVEEYNDLPYGGGTYTWQLILCSTPAASWTTSAPSNINPFPDGTFSGYTLIKSGSFDINPYISVSKTYFAFEWESPSEQWAKVIYPTGGTFDLDIPSNDWCSIQVWDEPDGTRITNPAGWISGRWLRIEPDTNNGSSDRDLTVRVSSSEAYIDISIHQESYVAPTFTFHVIGDFDIVSSGVDYTEGSSICEYTFAVDNFSPTSITIYVAVYLNDVEIDQVADTARDYPPYTTNGELTLGSVPSGAQYHIYLCKNPIEIM